MFHHRPSLHASFGAAAAVALLTGGAGTAHAAFTLVDDFEGSSLGSVVGQTAENGNVWQGTETDFTVVDTTGGDRALAVTMTEGNTRAYVELANTLAEGERGTYFFRFNVQTQPSGNQINVTTYDEDTIDQFAYAADLSIQENGTVDARGSEEVAYQTDTWYNVWLDLSTKGSGFYNAYIQAEGEATRTQITGDPDNDFDYRDDNADTLDFLNIWSYGGSGTGEVLLDDLYFDNSGFNAANPIPEPASLVLLGLGGSLALGRRRG